MLLSLLLFKLFGGEIIIFALFLKGCSTCEVRTVMASFLSLWLSLMSSVKFSSESYNFETESCWLENLICSIFSTASWFWFECCFWILSICDCIWCSLFWNGPTLFLFLNIIALYKGLLANLIFTEPRVGDGTYEWCIVWK